MIAGILSHTPLWVWALLALLVWLGLQRLKPRAVHPLRLLLLPAAFVLWGLVSLFETRAPTGGSLALWAGALVIGAAIGAALAPVRRMSRDGPRHLVMMPGSAISLIVILIRFAARYGSEVGHAIRPDLAAPLNMLDLAVAGLGAGYFLGWLGRIAIAYPHLPEHPTVP